MRNTTFTVPANKARTSRQTAELMSHVRSPLRNMIINISLDHGPLTMAEIEALVVARTGLPYSHKEVANAVANLAGDHKLQRNNN